MTGDGEPERLGGARVSANFFSLLGRRWSRRAAASRRRRSSPAEELVVVISDGLWRRRYGSDPTVVGRTIIVNGEGAPGGRRSRRRRCWCPPGTELHALVPFASRVDIWKPIAPTPAELKGESWDHGVLVRLPDGAAQEQGRQQLDDDPERLAARADARSQEPKHRVQLMPVREIFAGKVRLRLLLVLAASALLLLTACASIANVVLARVASRANEFATRIALGAGRARILARR